MPATYWMCSGVAIVIWAALMTSASNAILKVCTGLRDRVSGFRASWSRMKSGSARY